MDALSGRRAAFGRKPREGPWMQRSRAELVKGIYPER